MTNYSKPNDVALTKDNRARKLLISLSLLIVLLSSFFAPALVSYAKYDSNVKIEQAEAFDPVNWFMCLWGDDSIPVRMYQATQTSDLQYNLFSKSSLNSGIAKVDGGWNSIFKLFGYDFTKTNEAVLGVPLNQVGYDASATELEFNSGPRVNLFDRFGVAGLNFTSYAGEWKYFVVHPCRNGGEPQDPKAGVFYDGRLEPMSTWEEIGASKDVRTQQFSQAFFPAFGSAFNNHVANFFFGITKFIVILAIVLVNFAFSNVVDVLGIDKIISGDGSSGSGIFNTLFNNLFIPLAVVAFALTAIYIGYLGIVKRQFRNALGTLFKTIILYVTAIIVSVFSVQVVALPNTVAVVGQSLILQAMGGSLTTNGGLCATDKGTSKVIENGNGSIEFEKNQNLLSASSENMRSVIACQFWQTFLFKPWTEGQFGVDYNSLWADGYAPGLTNKEKELGNDNESWVGDASVPMGNGEFINNWAVFQLSTQTNAHSPINKPNETDITSLGVGRDWWRVVDAFSNYDEEQVSKTVISSNNISGEDITYTQPKETKVSAYWDTWVGNNSGNRIWVSISSTLIALIGLSLPLLFSLLSAVYSIGIALLMALAPMMLLFGIFQPTGWEIFKSWGQEVINLTIKRIVFGFLLVLSLIFTTAAIKVMDEVGWVQGLLLIIVFMFVLWKFKDKLLNSFAAVSFASANLSGATGKTVQKLKSMGASSGKVGMSSTVGAVASKRAGGTLRSGVVKGAKEELRQQMYRSNSPFAREMLSQHERHKGDQGDTVKGAIFDSDVDGDGLRDMTCSICGAVIPAAGIVGRTMTGSIICLDCYNEGMGGEGAREMYWDRTNQTGAPVNDEEEDETYYKNRQRDHARPKSAADTERGTFNKDPRFLGRQSESERASEHMQQIASRGDIDEMKEIERAALFAIGDDLSARSTMKHVETTKIPEIFKDFFGDDAKDMIAEAWLNGDYGFIQQMYAAALTDWLINHSDGTISDTYEENLKKIQEETDAQEAYTNRTKGRRVDLSNGEVETWEVNGEKRYADSSEDIYKKHPRKVEVHSWKVENLINEREDEIAKLRKQVESLSVEDNEALIDQMFTNLEKLEADTDQIKKTFNSANSLVAGVVKDASEYKLSHVKTNKVDKEMENIETSLKQSQLSSEQRFIKDNLVGK